MTYRSSRISFFGRSIQHIRNYISNPPIPVSSANNVPRYKATMPLSLNVYAFSCALLFRLFRFSSLFARCIYISGCCIFCVCFLFHVFYLWNKQTIATNDRFYCLLRSNQWNTTDTLSIFIQNIMNVRCFFVTIKRKIYFLFHLLLLLGRCCSCCQWPFLRLPPNHSILHWILRVLQSTNL